MAFVYRPEPDDQNTRDAASFVPDASAVIGQPEQSELGTVARPAIQPGPFQNPGYLRKEAGIKLRQQANSEGPWNQAKADLDDATAKLDAFGSTPKFMRHSEDGRVYSWALRDPATGQVQKSPGKDPDGQEIPGQSNLTPYDTGDSVADR